MSIKRNLLHEQATTIDAEKNRCNSLLTSKQNELENLKEELARERSLS